MWMEQDVLCKLAGQSRNGCSSSYDNRESKIESNNSVGCGLALAATTNNWWSQLKTAGAAIYANRHYLGLRQQSQRLLKIKTQSEVSLPPSVKSTTKESEGSYLIIGHVHIHPTATIHPTALVSLFTHLFYCY